MPRALAQNHTHQQPDESNVWTINHNLNCEPVVSVSVNYEGSLQVILPSKIEYTTLNTMTIFFTRPYSGVARLS